MQEITYVLQWYSETGPDYYFNRDCREGWIWYSLLMMCFSLKKVKKKAIRFGRHWQKQMDAMSGNLL